MTRRLFFRAPLAAAIPVVAATMEAASAEIILPTERTILQDRWVITPWVACTGITCDCEVAGCPHQGTDEMNVMRPGAYAAFILADRTTGKELLACSSCALEFMKHPAQLNNNPRLLSVWDRIPARDIVPGDWSSFVQKGSKLNGY